MRLLAVPVKVGQSLHPVLETLTPCELHNLHEQDRCQNQEVLQEAFQMIQGGGEEPGGGGEYADVVSTVRRMMCKMRAGS